MLNYIVLAVLIVGLFFAIRTVHKNLKGGGCAGGCSSCGGSCSCGCGGEKKTDK